MYNIHYLEWFYISTIGWLVFSIDGVVCVNGWIECAAVTTDLSTCTTARCSIYRVINVIISPNKTVIEYCIQHSWILERSNNKTKILFICRFTNKSFGPESLQHIPITARNCGTVLNLWQHEFTHVNKHVRRNQRKITAHIPFEYWLDKPLSDLLRFLMVRAVVHWCWLHAQYSPSWFLRSPRNHRTLFG